MSLKIEFEMYPGDWIQVDPRDLYDDQLVSLADRLEQGTIRIEELDDTIWSLWDFTLPPKNIRVVETG
ncbi:MAG: hypothetical protein HGA63_10925 [Syntrophobacteraceae bacterium]|nr:hypothetical protein [Syntrophobacteraceae bacterium]